MSNPTDDFDFEDLKSALNDATPEPNAARKAENLALAQKNFESLQGSRPQPRPTSRSNLWTGVLNMMNTLTSRAGMTVTTAIVACGFMVTTPFGRDMLSLDQNKISSPIEIAAESANDDVAALNDERAIPTLQGNPELGSNDVPAPQADALVAHGVNEEINAQLSSRVAESVELEQFQSIAPAGAENFANADPNPLKITSEDPVSTFSIDVDTASYSLVRNSLTNGMLPPADAVRVEEMINYFPYDYPAPDGAAPFLPTINVFETPWNPDTQLVHIGIQGELPAIEDRPPLNLVFLIDTSGSMDQPNKLPLLRQSFRLMLDNLNPEDEVAIVTYAGSTSIALQPTAASERDTILQALNSLRAGGSTNGQGGLEAAYALAESMSDPDAETADVSRVILATDGDFNVGLSDPRGLEDYIADKRDTGTYLSVLGFGRGNLQDATMQALAQNGNGTAAYIDTLSEAQKVLVDNLTGALIGYETRALNREDFNNDAVDAGELGAGHNVTAIYEVTPVGSPAQLSDPLRYQVGETTSTSDELGFLRLRYKAPGEDTSQLIETPITDVVTLGNSDAMFAIAMSGFGQLLRDETYLGDWGWDDAIELATQTRGADQFGYRTEAVQLMRLAQSLSN